MASNLKYAVCVYIYIYIYICMYVCLYVYDMNIISVVMAAHVLLVDGESS